MKRIILLGLLILLTTGLTPEEITQQYKQDFNTIRTQFKAGQITDIEANVLFEDLKDDYDEDMFEVGVITESKARKLEKERKQIIKQKWNGLQNNDLKIILLYLFNGTTYY